MRRTIQVVLTLVLFSAAMEGINYLAGDGISREFGAGFGFGGTLAWALVWFVIDRDECTTAASLVFLTLLVLATVYFGQVLGHDGLTRDLTIGPLVGLGVSFPLTYWASGLDRIKRGNPRPPISWRWNPGAETRRRSF